MSLINNMLRDLDQRRKSGSISPATMSLTPVSDSSEQTNVKQLILVALGAAALAIALSYYFLQISQRGTTTEQLERRVSINNTLPAVQEPISTEAARELAPPVQQVTVTPPAPVAEFPAQVISPELSVPQQTQQQQEIAAAVVNSGVDQGRNAGTAIDAQPVIASAIEVSGSRSAQTQQAPAALPTRSVLESRDATTEASSAITRNTSQNTSAERDQLTAQEALSLYNTNRVDMALRMLANYTDVNRDAHQSRETYAKLLMNQNSGVRAFDIVESGLAIAPNHAGYKKIKARLLLADNQVAAAAELLAARAPAISSDPEYYELLATAQLASQDYQNAIVTYTGLIRLDNLQGKWWYGIGAAYDSAGDTSSALQAYTQALQSANLSANLRQRSQRRVGELGL